jgi:hypothetical protein
MGKLLKGLAFTVTALTALIVGIAIGNSARKRIDRLGHAI